MTTLEATGSLETPTREVFGNIAPWMQVVFYLLMAVSLGSVVWRLWRRARLWQQGQPGGFERDWRVWVSRLVTYALAQKRVHRKSLGALLHLLLFSGFVVLTIGTTLLGIAHYGPVNFHRGWYYLVYELVMEVFGVAFCLGCALALYRRVACRPRSLGHQQSDWLLLGLLLGAGVTGFLVEALRLQYTQVTPGLARWSVVGQLLNITLFQDLTPAAARGWHLGFWWLHVGLVSALFAALPVTRFLHVITGPLNIAARPSHPMGALLPVKLEAVEQTGRTGVGALPHFRRQQLLSLDACMECGRCEEACPAWRSGKNLSPMTVVTRLRDLLPAASGNGRALHGETIAAETLWACTMCQACVQECPVLIGHVDLISDMRRFLVGEGGLAGTPAKALTDISRLANPFGQPKGDRMAWAAGLDVPTVESNPGYEYLFWVGCAAAYDPRAQKVARAMVRLLKLAGVNYAVLGRHERCTGDPARRIGDEFLFQEMARTNIATLNGHKARKIVTPCPHCHNTLQNEYSQFGGHYQVQHHSQLLAELLRTGRLESPAASGPSVTLHDPCYLARVNGEVKATRSVIHAAAGGTLREMPNHGKKTFCCGAGGGRMWFEETPAQRVSQLRAREAAATGARKLATACPFCLNMLSDATAAAPAAEQMQVLDIAEMLLEAQPASVKAR